MKSRQDVVNEYRNRQEKPEYRQIGVIGMIPRDNWSFTSVTNLVEEVRAGIKWLDFDCISNNKSEHVEMMGYISSKFKIIND